MKDYINAAALFFSILLLGTIDIYAQSAIKVACVGNSITEGSGLKVTYPQALQELLGEGYEVRNYGIGGRTLLKKGDRPYWNGPEYQEVLAWNPDIVIIKLGTNDTKPQNWEYKKDFVKDYKNLIKSFKKLPSKPKIYICNPIPVFDDKWGINEAALRDEIIPMIKKIARKRRVEVIDLYTPFISKENLTYDAIHPNVEGAALLAAEVYSAIREEETVPVK